jgi:hypothetical protein
MFGNFLNQFQYSGTLWCKSQQSLSLIQ